MAAAPGEQCWRVLLRDRRGHFWWPIVSAVDEVAVRKKALVLYPKARIIAIRSLHSVFPLGWHTRTLEHVP